MIAHTMLKREEGWRNTDRTSWGAVLSDHRRCGSSPPHTGGNRSLFTRLRLSSELRQHPTTQKTVRRFRHRDHTSADGLGFQVTIEDEPALLRRSARTGGQDHQTPITVPFPSNADHLWAVTATPSHAKYLSENFGNITKLVFRRQPVCCTTPTRSTPFGR
jgi:hypothetical protein